MINTIKPHSWPAGGVRQGNKNHRATFINFHINLKLVKQNNSLALSYYQVYMDQWNWLTDPHHQDLEQHRHVIWIGQVWPDGRKDKQDDQNWRSQPPRGQHRWHPKQNTLASHRLMENIRKPQPNTSSPEKWMVRTRSELSKCTHY